MRHFGFVMAAASLGVAAGAPFCVAAPLGLQLGAAILWTILCTGHRCRVHRPNPPDAPIPSKAVVLAVSAEYCSPGCLPDVSSNRRAPGSPSGTEPPHAAHLPRLATGSLCLANGVTPRPLRRWCFLDLRTFQQHL